VIETWSEQAIATLSASDNALYLGVSIGDTNELLDRCSCKGIADGRHPGEIAKHRLQQYCIIRAGLALLIVLSFYFFQQPNPPTQHNNLQTFRTSNMYTTIPLALSLFAVSALAAPPHLEARKGAAPVGGPATAKVIIYSSYTCAAPGSVSSPMTLCSGINTDSISRPRLPTAVQAQQPPSQSQKAHAQSHLLV